MTAMTVEKIAGIQGFVPGTTERSISLAPPIVFRPIRSWHSGVFAGERLEKVHGDSSGCMYIDARGSRATMIPFSYTHRLYWRKDAPARTVSAFLSYPNAMGCCPVYFWEIGGDQLEDVERFPAGESDDAELQMESRIIELLSRDGVPA